MKLEYKYDTNSTSYDNNGSMREQKVTVPTANGTAGFTATQTYSYDALNRLGSAEETIAGSTTLKQTFEIDRYGNRRFDTSTSGLTTTLGSCATMCNPTFDATNNRITSSGFSYDSSGNTTRDAADRKFTYDAENKQTKAETLSAGTNTVTGTIGEYSYDGDGRRVKKYVPSTGETTIFVYDAAGKQIAEYSTVVASANDAKVAYLTNDHLGSPRINTDVAGTVTARHDYHPFGEEIATSQRTSGLGYAADTVRKQFTGYERDGETDLDFAQARYMASTLGRFSSPDPQKIVVDVQLEKDSDKAKRLLENYLSKPGQWNRYVYAINNPLKYTDPDGREIRLSKDLTEAERNQILYYLSRNTRDKLNWKTDKDGNIVVTVTEVKGGGQNDGTRLIRRLSKYEKVTTIRLGAGGNATGVDNDTNASNGVGSDSTVTFNPNSNPLITTLDPKTGNGRDQIRPSHIGLIHELIHADHAARGTILTGDASYLYRDSNGTIQAQSYRREEFSTVGLGGLNNKMDITENNIRREQGLNLRAAY